MPCDRPDCQCPPVDDHVAVWHLVISGFTQHRGDPTGSQKLWLRLRSLLAGKAAQAVEFFCWNSNWNQVAEWIWRCQPEDRPAVVYIYAYSWGAGWGFVQLSRELRKRGIRVRRAVLCDPVYRSGLLGFCWLAISRLVRPVITVPSNVDWLWYCYQNFDAWPNPRGHRVVAESQDTVICNPRELVRTHHYMDDSAEWQDMAAGVAKSGRPAKAYRPQIGGEGVDL